MHIDALVVLQGSDVPHLAAHPERYAATKLLFVDPGIFDAALQAGAQNYELRRIDVRRDINTLAHTEALTRATAIDLALTEVRRSLWGDGAFHGWDQALLHLTLYRCSIMRSIGAAIERAFPEQRLGLLRPGNPALFNWDSMLTTEIVGADAARWSVVDRYPQAQQWVPGLLDACFDFDGVQRRVAAGRAACLTHIATCFYDAPAFEAAIASAFPDNIDLPGLYADVPVRRGDEVLLRRLGDAPFDADCTAYRERARQVFGEQLAAVVPSRAALAQQAEAFARRSHLQAVNFVGLRRALAGSRPQIVVSDHDTGANGPLFSVAAELGCAITVLPHSASPTSCLPHAERVTAVERDGVGTSVRTVLGQPVATRPVRFRPPVETASRQQPKRLCLLPNTMRGDGLSQIELFALIGFHTALSALCATHGWDLSVRLKPSTAALSVVSAALRMPAGYFTRTMQQPIAEVAAEADICIAFGEPTSGCIAFFDAGSYLLHVSEQDRASDYLATLPLATDLMPSLGCAAALDTLAELMRSPALYAQRQRDQADRYARRRLGAHDTIFPEPRA